MKQEEKYALIRAFAKEYKRSGKKERGRILSEVVKLTGYYKTYACELLTNPPGVTRKKIKRVRFSRYLSVVRVFIGYKRLDNQKQLKILHKLYPLISDYQTLLKSKNGISADIGTSWYTG